MRIAFYNIQNLFFRHQSLLEKPKNRCVLNWISELDDLVHKRFKSNGDLDRMQELSFLLNFDKVDKSKYGLLRSRGKSIYLKDYDYPVSGAATPGNSWNGWVELMNRPIDLISVSHKGRLISEIRPDILILQEVEDRESLLRFNSKILRDYPEVQYRHIVLIPGNDHRGLEQGVLLKNGFKINSLRIYSEDWDEKGGMLFQNSCLLYDIGLPGEQQLYIIAVQLQKSDHLKDYTDEKRLRQSRRIAEIYTSLIERGKKNILVAGNFNAPSYCYSLAPILKDTDLKDICLHPNFKSTRDNRREDYQRLGAYRKGINTRQLDYILVSPGLFKRVSAAGLNRKAMWAGTPPQWEMFRTVRAKNEQGSQHPALWVDVSF